MVIKFGTDGWRAIIAGEFTFANVRLVTQAVANYLQATQGPGEVVIGYDNRFLAPEFAAAVAEVLTGNGFTVYLPSRAVPTPVTAWAIKKYETLGALMLTASHNPPAYAGLKFIPDYAGPAVPAITEAIEKEIAAVTSGGSIKHMELAEARQRGMVKKLEPREDYLEYLRGLVDVEAIKQARLKVVVDPLYGAGIDYLDEFLQQAGCQVHTIHNYRDPLFGGSLPDPSGRGLSDLVWQVRATGADLGLALDGDADRFGVVDGDGTYLTANEVLYLVLAHLIFHRQSRGAVARTVATTHNLDRLAAAEGLQVIETPVGFKYIGEALRQHDCILGGEESGGLSIRGHIPEKDGILATALVAELRAVQGRSLNKILADLQERHGRLVSRRVDIEVAPDVKARVLRQLPHFTPARIAGVPVTGCLAVDGVKFILADGSWVLLRPSGTEPLLRLYVEAPADERLRLLQEDIISALKL
ncbi:phosphoglucomutase/phosphomannomutase family protein [Moorella sulfitireducens (nom. illeg.)]|uniref:phosphoglucomutase/phosphomannomutase family protein n=1 Tax=Neomoorella sulfitireducens TaxID=2972948 RepID=UPI0021ACD47C|nr:phosphoglucomutase/phosphomannomutase family protein [Moorella sulfitireducens]